MKPVLLSCPYGAIVPYGACAFRFLVPGLLMRVVDRKQGRDPPSSSCAMTTDEHHPEQLVVRISALRADK